MLTSIFNKIKQDIEEERNLSPFLFLGENLELLNSKVKDLSIDILNSFNIPKNFLFILNDNNEKIKISQIKDFINPSNSIPSYKVQIFIIENISRFTTSAANSCLKFFEEPKKGNLIFLTNKGENQVLDTILSRVNTINLKQNINKETDSFYFSMINSYIRENNTEILSYFFRNKLEKEDYIKILNNIILYFKSNLNLGYNLFFLEELNTDLNSIVLNNVNAKFIVDKWLLRIKK